MSDAPQGPGWWQASDGKWYPPTAKPGTPRPTAGPGPGGFGPGTSPAGSPPYGPPPGPYGPGPTSYGPGPRAYGPGPAPYGYGYGYAPNPNGTPSGLPSVSGFATASLVLGILSLFICCAPFMLGSLAGLPLGIYALTRINKRAADPGPRGVAIAGVVVNGIGLALLAIVAVAWASGS